MSIALTGVQGWASEVQSAMTALPAELEQAAPTDGFASVLAQAAAALHGRLHGAPTAGASPAAASTTAAGSLTLPLGTTSTGLGGAPWSVGGTAGQQVVADTRRYLGTPYVWGGESPSGFDCSGLVQYVYRQVGVTLPRTTYTQVRVGTAVPSLAQAQPGDLVFFAGSDGTDTSPGHVGIYIGNGQMIDAPYTGAAVRVDPVGDPVAIRRVLPSTAVATPGVTLAASGSIGTGVPSNLAPLFVSAAAKYGVPVRLLTAVAYHESRYEPRAVSSAGAEGIMQILPGTAAGLGITPFTPAQAIDGAARLFSGYLQQFGSVPLALAAYDAGAGAVQQYGGVPPYAETQAYVQTIMQKLGGVA